MHEVVECGGFKKIFQEIAQTKTFTKFRKLMSYKTKATSGGGGLKFKQEGHVNGNCRIDLRTEEASGG